MDMWLQEYGRNDAEMTFRFQEEWDRRFIRIRGLWYDRQEWERYLREKKRWAREDPTVEVERPFGSRCN